jgi:hypothetical protein
MFTTLIFCLAAAPLPTEAVPASAAVASARAVQDPVPVQDKRPDIEKMIDEGKKFDYGIMPPKAMLGMLKTDPKVVVTFETVLSQPAQ